MSDLNIRMTERRALAGDPEATASLYLESLRRGRTTRLHLQAAERLGHEGAACAMALSPVPIWFRVLWDEEVTGPDALEMVLASGAVSPALLRTWGTRLASQQLLVWERSCPGPTARVLAELVQGYAGWCSGAMRIEDVDDLLRSALAALPPLRRAAAGTGAVQELLGIDGRRRWALAESASAIVAACALAEHQADARNRARTSVVGLTGSAAAEAEAELRHQFPGYGDFVARASSHAELSASWEAAWQAGAEDNHAPATQEARQRKRKQLVQGLLEFLLDHDQEEFPPAAFSLRDGAPARARSDGTVVRTRELRANSTITLSNDPSVVSASRS